MKSTSTLIQSVRDFSRLVVN